MCTCEQMFIRKTTLPCDDLDENDHGDDGEGMAGTEEAMRVENPRDPLLESLYRQPHAATSPTRGREGSWLLLKRGKVIGEKCRSVKLKK